MSAPDGGWGWIVVVGSTFSFMVFGGVERSFGVWYIEALHRYEAGATLTAWSIGICITLALMLYPLASVLYKKTSSRFLIMSGGTLLSIGILGSAFVNDIVQFYFKFSVIGGVGISFASFGQLMALSEYFDERKFLAVGIAFSGLGLGNFAISPLLSYMFRNLTYIETIVYLAGISLHVVVTGALCFPIYENEGDDNETGAVNDLLNPTKRTALTPMKIRKIKGNRTFNVGLLRNPVMVIYAIGAAISMMGSFPIPQLLPHFVVEHGETKKSAAFLLSIYGLMEVLCRPLLGLILTHRKVKPYAVVVWDISITGFTFATLAIAFSRAFWHFIPGVLMMAICQSISRAFAVTMFSAIFEWSVFADAYSIYSIALGCGSLCGTLLGGYMKDSSDSYFLSYILMSGLCLFGSSFYWLNYFLIKRLRQNPRYHLVYERQK